MSARYQRQSVLAEIGPEGQAKLAKARVLVVGAGGLGCPVLLYLVAAGVGQTEAGGYLGIIDDDVVDLSNLQRQVLFSEQDVGQPKVHAAVKRLQALNNDIDLRPLPLRLTSDNILDLLANYDMVVDGSDNFATKYLINDAAVKLGKPVVYGSILGFEGQAAIFWAAYDTKHGAKDSTKGACYRCLYPAPPKTYIPNCAEFGTLGSMAGLIGSVQAMEVCKLALGLEHCQQEGLEPLISKLWCMDARGMDVRTVSIPKNAHCPVCSLRREEITLEASVGAVCATQQTTNPSTTLTLSDLQSLQAKGHSPLLLDVRQYHEWEAQHLPDALLIPLAELLSDPEQLYKLDRQREIVVYCQMGMRSQTAAHFLREQGYHVTQLVVDWSQV